MKRKNKVLIALVLVVVISFAASSAVVSLFGKNFIEHKLTAALGTKVTLGGISLNFPLTIHIKDIRIGELFRAERLSFSPDILGALSARVVVSGLTVINPVVNLELSAEGRLNLPAALDKGKGPQQQQAPDKKEKEPAQERKKRAFLLTGVNIKNGKFIFTDKKIMPQGYQTVIKGINIKVAKEMFPPASLKINFNLQGEVADIQGNNLGGIYASGWVDLGPKDMDGKVELEGLELIYFSPYYGNFLSSRKLLSAKLSTLSRLEALNNDLQIATKLKLYDLAYARQEKPEKISPASVFELARKSLDLFLDPEGNLNLEFTIRTKLDKPQVTIADLKALVLEAAIENLSSQSPVELFKKGTELIEQFKDFGEGMGELF